MVKTTLKIDGMMCGMCETHINEALRKSVTAKKVKSSHKKGETVIISEDNLDEQVLREAIKNTGYNLTDMKSEPYEKKGLFG
ncbi:MAG: heavy-metal-associated domain-containing protein [Lachnospiraceae bacterium]|nr:heavy-metal-associated domain-containing protein [Lachnospiraceae bacterium]